MWLFPHATPLCRLLVCALHRTTHRAFPRLVAHRPPCALHLHPHPRRKSEAHRAGFFCALSAPIFYQAVYSKPPNYQVIVLVNCTLILAHSFNYHPVYVHFVDWNQSDKIFLPYFLFAQNCRVEKLQTPSSISLQPQKSILTEAKMSIAIRFNQGDKTYLHVSGFALFQSVLAKRLPYHTWFAVLWPPKCSFWLIKFYR